MKRYMILEEKKGVFLGMYLSIPIYASDERLNAIKAYTFENRLMAEEFIKTDLTDNRLAFSVVEVEAVGSYIHVAEIIRQGFGLYTHRMMNNIEMSSTMVH